MIANNHSINNILFRWGVNTRVFKPCTEIQEIGYKKIYGNTGSKIEESKEITGVPFVVFPSRIESPFLIFLRYLVGE